MHDFYPFNYAGAVMQKHDDGDLCVTRHRSGHLCGYVAFPAKDTPAEWVGNYNADALQYLAVHGGLTYAKRHGDWCVFGFDCAHSGDDERMELRDTTYVMALTRQMREQMILLRTRLDEYRKGNREQRVTIIEEIREKATEKTEFGFGALIGMMAGAPELGPKEGNAA